MTKSGGAGEDFIGGFGPYERLGALVGDVGRALLAAAVEPGQRLAGRRLDARGRRQPR